MYTEVLQRLFGARRFGVVLGLSRMRALLDALGAPDRQLGRVIHVAGTNGKGSTVALCAAILRAAGVRVATYTSPHLSTIRERITVDGEPISEAAFVAAAERVRAAGGDELTFFEQVTAIGMCAIADASVEVSVIEVGLGGRLDATNVIAADVAVITGVALDHQDILGDTLAQIAAEKAGIIKPGQAVVIGAAGEAEAVPLLVAHARAQSTQPIVVDAAMIAALPPVALVGEHQRANAAAAVAAVRALDPVLAQHAAAGLAQAVHPGRFEELPGGVILDGAHNPHGAAALARALRARDMRPTLVLAVSTGKDVPALLAALLPAVGDVVVTRYAQDRALPPDDLAHAVRTADPARTVHVAASLREALTLAQPPLVIAGSLFLVGEARTLLLGAPSDPFALSDPSATR